MTFHVSILMVRLHKNANFEMRLQFSNPHPCLCSCHCGWLKLDFSWFNFLLDLGNLHLNAAVERLHRTYDHMFNSKIAWSMFRNIKKNTKKFTFRKQFESLNLYSVLHVILLDSCRNSKASLSHYLREAAKRNTFFSLNVT